MKVLISGASGLIGKALKNTLLEEGHQVSTLVRHNREETDTINWNPSQGIVEAEKLNGFDAIIHLSGENIAKRRWNAKFKREVYNSRVKSTKLLCENILTLKDKPRVFVCASAIGIFGNRGEEVLSENSSTGSGFLAEVCLAWEKETEILTDSPTRVINARFGMVLSSHGGALKKMLPPFKLGLGGRIGDGRQFISWISIADTVSAIIHCLKTETLNGPVNFISPNPLSNLEFTKELGSELSRPTFFPLPVFVVKLLFGEMGQELLLSSTRAIPKELLDSGFCFKHPTLDEALKAVLAT